MAVGRQERVGLYVAVGFVVDLRHLAAGAGHPGPAQRVADLVLEGPVVRVVGHRQLDRADGVRLLDQVVGSDGPGLAARSEEQTYELKSLMRTTYAVLCLKKKNI